MLFIQRQPLRRRQNNDVLEMNNLPNWLNKSRLIVLFICYLQKISSHNFSYISRRQNCASTLSSPSRFALFLLGFQFVWSCASCKQTA